ncbi:MAG: hypothetical protein AABX32_08285, partial [Nanoarchaeota archaeon]
FLQKFKKRVLNSNKLLVIKINGVNHSIASVYRFMSPGQCIPDPRLEPGMYARLRGNNQTPLVERVRFEHGYKKTPGWKYYAAGSGASLDDELVIGGEWRNGSPRPQFRKGELYSLKFSPEGHPLDIIVMSQTSLDDAAHVDFVYSARDELYSIPIRTLQKLLAQNKSNQKPAVSALHVTA